MGKILKVKILKTADTFNYASILKDHQTEFFGPHKFVYVYVLEEKMRNQMNQGLFEYIETLEYEINFKVYLYS